MHMYYNKGDSERGEKEIPRYVGKKEDGREED
jgi:hypothetical protein